MSKKKILIFIDWFLPGYKAGGPIQSCANLIAHLKGEYDFWVITRDTDYCESEPYQDVVPDTWNRREANVQVYYTSEKNLKYNTLSKAVAEAKPDVVFINGIYSFYFSILPLLILKRMRHEHVIVSARGMLAPSAVNVKGGKKKLFLKAAKLLGLYNKVYFHATNETEKQHIQAFIGQSQAVVVAPNLPKLATLQLNNKRLKEQGVLNLVSIARISPEKNTKYALDVLAICKFEGRVTYDIYGPIYNEVYWQECLEVIKNLPENITVTYKGSLDSSLVAETLCGYHALFLPTRGENFGHIILESFSAGCPVLISDQTPWRGLSELKLGYDLPLTHVGNFISAIESFLTLDQLTYDEWSRQAFQFAQQFVTDKEGIRQNQIMFKQNS